MTERSMLYWSLHSEDSKEIGVSFQARVWRSQAALRKGSAKEEAQAIKEVEKSAQEAFGRYNAKGSSFLTSMSTSALLSNASVDVTKAVKQSKREYQVLHDCHDMEIEKKDLDWLDFIAKSVKRFSHGTIVYSLVL